MPLACTRQVPDPWQTVERHREHQDHSGFFAQAFHNPQEVTRACLDCHPAAAREVMATPHWTWENHPQIREKDGKVMLLGKKHVLNNFCISISGNWMGCTSCHAGYGWEKDTFDFSDPLRVDCLVCHDWSGTYTKGEGGWPKPEVDLLASARSVGYPRRDNCAVCHAYGGGGSGVKHGDLDSSLLNPPEHLDVHMGQHNMLCIDCHQTKRHLIAGRSYGVGVNPEGGFDCARCHGTEPHQNARINSHTATLACVTCHIPAFATRQPTKMTWDWSAAGDTHREDDPHRYLKIKGAFTYGNSLQPEYRWFNRSMDRYLLGDPLAADGETDINTPQGGYDDRDSRIWPFKVHVALQPADKVHQWLIPPVTAGEGGYWHLFNWYLALKKGAELAGLPFSGQYGFVTTRMYWPLHHLVVPGSRALSCVDCHHPAGEGQGRMDWKRLGYRGDPQIYGGRRPDSGSRTAKGAQP